MLAAPLAGCLDDAEVITTNNNDDDTLIGNNTTTNETADNNTGNSTTMPERGNNTFSCDALTCGCDPRLCDEDNNTIVRDWDNMTEEDWCNWNGNEWQEGKYNCPTYTFNKANEYAKVLGCHFTDAE